MQKEPAPARLVPVYHTLASPSGSGSASEVPLPR